MTIHGINTKGTWQTALEPVFSPHFRYRAIAYPHYRTLGAPKLLVEPWIVLAAAAAFGLWIVLGSRIFPGVLTLVAGVIDTLLFAHGLAAMRRRSACLAALRQFDDHVGVGERAYVIAHSFGTYLCGFLLQRPTTRCSRIIFAGSVLSRDFMSKRLRSRGEIPFEELRNEIGLGDFVAGMAGLVRGLVPDLGDAGLRGFVADGEHVHSVDRPDQQCVSCASASSRPGWLVHNVEIGSYAHSDQFITPRHATQFWLPFLWGIDAHEFREWLEWCRAASHAGQAGLLGAAGRIAEAKLLHRRWGWADSTIKEFISFEYPSLVARLEDPLIAIRIYRALWAAVDRGCSQAESHGGDARRIAEARALDPRVAVQIAAGVVEP